MVLGGGAFGALARWGVNLWLPSTHTGFPWSTTLVNMLGCLIIGWLSVLLHLMDERLQLLLLVGFLGAFTTFSTYAYELVRMGEAAQFAQFIFYMVLSNAGGLLCVLLGRKLFEWI